MRPEDRLAVDIVDPVIREKLFLVWFTNSSASCVDRPEEKVLAVLRRPHGAEFLDWQIHIGEMLVKHRHDGDGVDERSVRGRLGDLRALRDRLSDR